MEDRPAQEIWEAALGELQVQVSKPNYRTWLEPTVGLSYQGNEFVVGVPNTFVAEYLSKNQRCLIEKTLIGLTQRHTNVVFQVNSHCPAQSTGYSSQQGAPPARPARPPRLNPKYTFDSFVVGSCNRLAYAAALEVAENPGRSYNPLFIHGGVGLGKTHLLQAIGHVALADNLNILYVSAERFTNDFVTSIQERKTEEFNTKYRGVDILLIDDIYFINGKEQTQEAFFHTFNELHNANHQIAITSNRPPKAMPWLEDRLLSRFEWVLVVDIQPPDFETSLAILQAKAKEEGVKFIPAALEFLAQQIQQNMRELEGCLNRVIALARLTGALVTPELATQALSAMASKQPKEPAITPSLVVATVAESFQLAPVDLAGRRRDKETALARQVAIYLIKQETSCSLARIGQELGGRNHSTIIHAYDKIAGEINTNPYLQRKVSEIQQDIHRKLKGRKA